MRAKPPHRRVFMQQRLGKPRRLQGRLAAAWTVVIALWAHIDAIWGIGDSRSAHRSPSSSSRHRIERLPVAS